jgi:hypothetical protein
MQYLKYFFGGKVMGCFGGGHGGSNCDSGFGIEMLIILAVLFFLFCNGDSGILSDLFDNCNLVWIAIILLLLFVCNNDECDD